MGATGTEELEAFPAHQPGKIGGVDIQDPAEGHCSRYNYLVKICACHRRAAVAADDLHIGRAGGAKRKSPRDVNDAGTVAGGQDAVDRDHLAAADVDRAVARQGLAGAKGKTALGGKIQRAL